MVLWDTFFEAGRGQLNKGSFAKAEELFKSALGEAESFEQDDPRRLRTLLALVEVHQKCRRPEAGRPYLEEALSKLGLASLDLALKVEIRQAELAQLEVEEAGVPELCETWKGLLQLHRQGGAAHLKEREKALEILTGLYLKLTDFEAAQVLLEERLELVRQEYGAESLEAAEVLQSFAETLVRSGDELTAERHLREALTIRERGEQDTVEVLGLLSKVLESQKRYQEALKYVARAAEQPGPRQSRFRLMMIEAKLRLGEAEDALGLLNSLDKAELPEESQSAYELSLLRGYGQLNQHAARLAQAKRMVRMTSLGPRARVEAHLVIGEAEAEKRTEEANFHLEEVLADLGVGMHDDGALLARIADLARGLGQREAASECYELAISAFKEHLVADSPDSVDLLFQIGTLYEHRRSLTDAVTYWERSLESLKRFTGQLGTASDERQFRNRVVICLAQAYLRQRRWDRAEQAWRSLLRSAPPQSRESTQARIGLGLISLEQGQVTRIREFLDVEPSIPNSEADLGRELYDLLFSLNVLSETELGQPELALRMVQERVVLRGDLSRLSVTELWTAVRVGIEGPRSPELVKYAQSLAQRQPIEPEEQISMARFYAVMAGEYSSLLGGLPPKDAIEQAIHWAVEANGHLDLFVAEMFEQKAKISVASSAWDAAEEATRRSLELRRVLQGERSVTLLNPLQRLGELLLGRGEMAEGITCLTKALALGDAHLSADHSSIRELLRSLVEAYRRSSEIEEARGCLERLLSLYDRFEELPPEERLDDLMRGIRLLLGGPESVRGTLLSYLEEALTLAERRGENAAPSFAFCLGQRARLLAEEDPGEALRLLERQRTLLENREERVEFEADRWLLARLQVFRGFPNAALLTLAGCTGDNSSRPSFEPTLIAAGCYLLLGELEQATAKLALCEELLERFSEKQMHHAFEVAAHWLDLQSLSPERVTEEKGNICYGILDQVAEKIPPEEVRGLHKVRLRWSWELSRLRFEVRRLAEGAALERLSDQIAQVRLKAPMTSLALFDALVLLGLHEESMDLYDACLSHLRQAVQILDEFGDIQSIQSGYLSLVLGRVSEKRGFTESALRSYRDAQQVLENHFPSEHRELLPVYLGLGRLAQGEDDIETAQSALGNALRILEKPGQNTDRQAYCAVLRDIARLEFQQGRHPEALETWRRVQQAFAEEGQAVPSSWLSELTEVYCRNEEIDDALDLFLEALEKRVGPASKTLLELYDSWLKRVAEFPSDDAKALQIAGRLGKVRSHLFDEDEAGAEMLLLWSEILLQTGRLVVSGLLKDNNSAVQGVERALEIRERLDGEEAVSVGEALQVRAELALAEQETDVAERCLTRALNIVESRRGADTWDAAAIMIGLAAVYFQKQRFSSMEAVIQRGYELCETLLRDDDLRWVRVLYLRGRFYFETGRFKEANESLLRALSLVQRKDRKPDLELLIDAGRSCLHSEQRELALSLLQQAVARFPTEPEELTEQAEDVFLPLGELCLSEGMLTEAEEYLQRALLVQEKRWGVGDARLSRLYRLLAAVSVAEKNLELAEERFEIALALQDESLFQPNNLFDTFVSMVEALIEGGDIERAAELLEEQLGRISQEQHPSLLARLAGLLADIHFRSGRVAQAEEARRLELEAYRTVSQSSPEMRFEQLESFVGALHSLAELLLLDRRFTEAEELTKERLKLIETSMPDDTRVTEVLFDLAEIYRQQELYREAYELHQRVLSTRAGNLGRTHPLVSQSVRALGLVYFGQGKTEEAMGYLDRALEQQVTELGPDHPDLAETLFALGATSLASGDFALAEERYRRALDILRDTYGEGDIRTARAWAKLAELFETKQQWSDARPLLGRAVESVEALLGPSHLEVADLLEKTAAVYLASGAWGEVLEPLERAIAIRTEKLGPDSPALGRLLKLDGQFRTIMGDLSMARRQFARADQVIADYYGAESSQRQPYRLAYVSALRQLEEWEEATSQIRELLSQLSDSRKAEEEVFLSGVHLEAGQLEMARGDLKEAESHLKKALDIRSRLCSPKGIEVAEALEQLAQLHRLDGRSITASALAERALEMFPDQYNVKDGQVELRLGRARVLLLLAKLDFDQENHSSAQLQAQEVLGIQREVFGDAHPELATVIYLLGEIALGDKRLERAENFFEQALQRWEEFYGTAHAKVFQVVSSLAKLYQQQGRLTLAQQYHQRNLEALEKRYGPNHPALAETLIGLGRLFRSQGVSMEAERYLKQAAEIQTSVYGERDPKVANVLHLLALVYQDQRNYLAAEALLKKALQIRESVNEPETSELSESHLALARLYRSSGKGLEAEPLLKKVLEWRTRRYGEDHPEVAAILREMAELYGEQKEYLKAQVLVNKAILVFEESLGNDSVELVGPLRQLIRFLEASGDDDEAMVHRQRVEKLIRPVDG